MTYGQKKPPRVSSQPGTGSAASSSVDRPLSKAIVGEIQHIAWMTASLFLLLSLVSYQTTDTSWNSWSSHPTLNNWMGRAGSILADLCTQLFGGCAYLLVFLLGLAAFRAGNFRFNRNLLWGTLWMLAVSSHVESVRSEGLGLKSLQFIWPTGGAIGHAVAQGLSYIAGPIGSVFLSFALCIVTTVVFTERLLLVWATQFGSQFFSLVIQASRTAWMAILRQARALASTPTIEPAKKLSEPPFQLEVAREPALGLSPQKAEPVVPEPPAADVAGFPSSDAVEQDEEMRQLVRPRNGSSKAFESGKSSTERPKNSTFELPGLQILSGKRESSMKSVDRAWYLEKSQILVEKLKDFGVDGEVVNISPGPVITVYEFKPASGVKIKDIANLSDDLTLALSVLSVRIVAPIPGKPVVGIEIPTPHRQTVYFKDMIEETPFFSGDVKIPIVLGRLASGEPVLAGLAAMPHLLVAGSTGTGKSVFINNLICSLLYRYTPDQLKLILVDPKMVELASYEGIPHLLLPVVVDSRKAAMALRWTVDEMERRYSLLHQYGVRHLDAYNEKLGQDPNRGEATPLPYIVVVIDEYADLMAVVPKDVELSIARLAQKARASGIHLVLATQRPSTDVVTGTIKANFPSRISFRVASSVDSKTILDRPGADRLLGNGDMLFHSAGFSTLKRIQGAFLSDADMEAVVNHLKAQGQPEFDEGLLAASSDPEALESGGDTKGGASLYDQAVRLVSDKGEASISLIQRHLKIGYNRAASLMEEMEKQGVVGEATGASKRRPVMTSSI